MSVTEWLTTEAIQHHRENRVNHLVKRVLLFSDKHEDPDTIIIISNRTSTNMCVDTV